MLAVLSPAKSLDNTPVKSSVKTTDPALMSHTEELMKTTKRLTQKKIKELMKLSDDLTKLNYDRFRSFELPFTDKNALPAAFTFAGDVYRGFDARTLDKKSLAFAQEHIAILSGLYGLLRPLDKMQAYRLEMGTRLENKRGKNLYAFWGEHIAEEIVERTKDHDDSTLVNLASNEYFKATGKKVLKEHPTVTCVFEDYKEDVSEGRVVSFLAKIARGKMARFIAENGVDRREGLKDFAVDRYKLIKARSTDDKLVFARKFIPVNGGL